MSKIILYSLLVGSFALLGASMGTNSFIVNSDEEMRGGFYTFCVEEKCSAPNNTNTDNITDKGKDIYTSIFGLLLSSIILLVIALISLSADAHKIIIMTLLVISMLATVVAGILMMYVGKEFFGGVVKFKLGYSWYLLLGSAVTTFLAIAIINSYYNNTPPVLQNGTPMGGDFDEYQHQRQPLVFQGHDLMDMEDVSVYQPQAQYPSPAPYQPPAQYPSPSQYQPQASPMRANASLYQ